MELLPNEVKEILPPLRGQENEADPICYVKFFHPLSPWTWFILEYDPEDHIFFAWVDGDYQELGYVSLDELEDIWILGLCMERDLHFEPTRLSVVKSLYPPK